MAATDNHDMLVHRQRCGRQARRLDESGRRRSYGCRGAEADRRVIAMVDSLRQLRLDRYRASRVELIMSEAASAGERKVDVELPDGGKPIGRHCSEPAEGRKCVQ